MPEKYIVQLSLQARKQLAIILDDIAEHRSEYASEKQRLVFGDFFVSLELTPERFVLSNENLGLPKGTRTGHIKHYNIYYRADNATKQVEISAIIHASRNQKHALSSN